MPKENMKQLARHLRESMLPEASAWLADALPNEADAPSTRVVRFDPVATLTPEVLASMVDLKKQGNTAIALPARRCPVKKIVKDGVAMRVACGKATAAVTAKYNLQQSGHSPNSFFCVRCGSQLADATGQRLVSVWWEGMGDQEPLQLVLEARHEPAGNSSSDQAVEIQEALLSTGTSDGVSIHRWRIKCASSRKIWEGL
jgi:hypothetical protein